MKINTKMLCRAAILLALCIASQFLKNTSDYITGPIINAILIIATLSCGFIGASAIGLITPLTAWLITGSPIMSSYPAIVPCVMLGNVILVSCVWLFSQWLQKKFVTTSRLKLSDPMFRTVILIALIACALWTAIMIAFFSTIASALEVDASALLVMTLLSVVGVFLVFVCLWALAARFPTAWMMIAGMVIGSILKALFMWLMIVQTILPAATDSSVKLAFSVTQLLTALIGSAIAFLVWIPLKKLIPYEPAKSEEAPAEEAAE